MKIVTGYTPEDDIEGNGHITSDDWSALNQGIVGPADYSLSKLTAVASTGNTITLPKGEIVIQGVHCRLDGTETVTIEQGTQGLYRNDLICARYEKSVGTNYEDVTVAVKKGTASKTAVDPAITKNDIRNGGRVREVALFRISLYGSVIQSITTVIPELRNLKSIDDTLKNHADVINNNIIPRLNTAINNITTLLADVKELKSKLDFKGTLRSVSDNAKAAVRSWTSSFDSKGKPSVLGAGLYVQDAKGTNLASLRLLSSGHLYMYKGDSSYLVRYVQEGDVEFTGKTATDTIGQVEISNKKYDVKATKGTVVTKDVKFTKAYTSVPTVVATARTPRPDITSVGVTDVTKTGFKLHYCRDSTATVNVNWIAVGSVGD